MWVQVHDKFLSFVQNSLLIYGFTYSAVTWLEMHNQLEIQELLFSLQI